MTALPFASQADILTVAAPVEAQSPEAQSLLSGFHLSPWFGEQVHEQWIEPGVRVVVNAPATLDAAKPVHLIVFATPNGNTIEQTLGSALTPTSDWHFDIQHIAAQVRRLRELRPSENIVLACVQAEEVSWPAWRAKHADSGVLIRGLVEKLRALVPSATPVKVSLSGHSGGGSFLFGFINGGDTIPDYIDRIAWLDANYSYDDTPDHHGDKLLAWLKGDATRHLVVIAYDDRNIEIDGKKVVGPDGGTFRASGRMRDRFSKDMTLTDTKAGNVETYTGMGGRVLFRIHLNPENKILHTVLVGEMNGFLEAMTQGTPQAGQWGTFGVGPRAYTKWVQGAPGIPDRPADAVGGAAFLKSIDAFTPAQREAAIGAEICRGNIPPFLRNFQTIEVKTTDAAGKEHTVAYQVMPDYLAVGSDTDFVRIPMTPQTAQLIADAFGCSLPTRKIVDDVYKAATVKLEPHPLTEAREAPSTFGQFNAIIEGQRAGQPLGALVAGHKKDVVITNRLGEKAGRVAIYGWHKLDGLPIQPLTTVHKDFYVDYSHGVRLVKRAVIVDGRTRDIRMVLHDADLNPLFSDEGPVSYPSY